MLPEVILVPDPVKVNRPEDVIAPASIVPIFVRLPDASSLFVPPV